MTTRISRELLFDHFAGNATESQDKQIDLWREQSADNNEFYYEMLEEYYAGQVDLSSEYSNTGDVEFQKLKARIEEDGLENGGYPFKKRAYQALNKWSKVAAVFALMLIGLSGYLYYDSVYGYTTYSTDYGEVETIILPDNSEVRLNANSSIKVANHWEKDRLREVWLKGEAFFNVVHTKSNQKFVVRNNDVLVEVLGTEFNVDGRSKNTQVVLNSGKVRLKHVGDNENQGVYMEPGEMVEYENDYHTFKKQKVDTEVHTSWQRQEYVFKQTPFSEIIKILEEDYGLEVQVKNEKLLTQEFTATLPGNNLDVLVKALSKSFGLKVYREDDVMILQ